MLTERLDAGAVELSGAIAASEAHSCVTGLVYASTARWTRQQSSAGAGPAAADLMQA